MIGDSDVDGRRPYLKRLVKWCEEIGLKIILDLHGAPGSQNGMDHSGMKGKVKRLENWLEIVDDKYFSFNIFVGSLEQWWKRAKNADCNPKNAKYGFKLDWRGDRQTSILWNKRHQRAACHWSRNQVDQQNLCKNSKTYSNLWKLTSLEVDFWIPFIPNALKWFGRNSEIMWR